MRQLTLRMMRPVAVLMAVGLVCSGAMSQAATGAGGVIYPAIDGLTEVKSLDVVAEGDTLHALLIGQFTQRGRVAVAYVISADGGRTWRPPVFVDPVEAGPALSRRGDDGRLAVQGKRLVAVWQAKSELPGAGEIALAVSDDRGRTWRASSNPAVGDRTHNQSHMAVALDRAGHIHLVWLDDREENGNTQGLRYAMSTDGGVRWQPEATLDGATCTCCWTQLTVLPDGSLSALYRDSDPHDMRLTRLDKGIRQWRDMGTVGGFDWHFTGCPHCGGGLVATGTAKAAVLHSVVWTGKDGAAGLYYLRSDDRGGHWSAPLPVGDVQAHESDLAGQPNGMLGLAFVPGRSTVNFRFSKDAGRHWSPAVPLNSAEASADHPRVVAVSNGFRVFWTETRQGGGKTWAMAVQENRAM